MANNFIHFTDEGLMREIASGEQEAFEVLYNRYSDRMLRFFYRMFHGDEEKAQDFLQNLFLRLIEKAHLYTPDRKFSTWLYTVASNLCKNEFRSLAVRSKVSNVNDLGQLHVSSEECLHGHLIKKQFQLSLEKALQKLSAEHRSVIILKYQEELSIKEISEIMKCSEGTVKSRVYYALKKLSKVLHMYHPKASL